MTELRLDWCGYDAAKYAVEHWHYSQSMPLGKMVKIGVWEDSQFIGAVLFARGSTPTLGNPYGLEQTQVCELVRIALKEHKAPVSKIGTIAIKMLKKQSTDLRLIVSFADTFHNHHGGIYQAMNWIYTGQTVKARQWFVDGEWKHNREVTSGAFGGAHLYKGYQSLPSRELPPKHRYLYPLDDAMRKQIEPLRKPYPKRERGETDNAPQSNAETDGASPIRSLLKVTT
jgi:hypothetical protein